MASGSPELGHIERGLVKHAESALSNRGYFLSSTARSMLTQYVITGAQRMRKSGEPAPDEIEKARASVERLVDEISQQAKLEQQRLQENARRQGLDYTQVSLTTISDQLVTTAMASLCPGLWPFC
jgi:predicted RNA-binding protein with PIN domain